MSKRGYQPSVKKQQELKRQVKNYNAKIDRLMKKGVDVDLLPQKMKASTELKNVRSTKELNDTLKSIQTFTTKGAEKTTKYQGIDVAEWQKKELQRLTRRQSAMKKQLQIKAEKESLFGVEHGKTFLGDATKRNVPQVDFKNIKDPKHATEKIQIGKKRFSERDKEEKNNILKENFISAVNKNLMGIDYNGTEIHILILNEVAKHSNEEFFEIFKANPDSLHIPYIYVEPDREAKALEVLATLERY